MPSTARCLAPAAPRLLKPHQGVRPSTVSARRVFASINGSERQRSKIRAAPQQCHRQLPGLPAPLSRLLAGCSAAAASLFVPLLPSWSSESFDYLNDNYSLDPSVAESPDILNTLLIVVVTYFTVMLLYLWLSSFLDDDLGQSSDSPGSNSQRPPADQELPPGYGSFLDAHVRSYVDPHAPSGHRQVTALQELGQALPLEGEDLEQLKGRLAAGAAEALEQQIRDCERLVRSKLLSRKLGYMPARSSSAAGSSNGNSSAAGQQQSSQPSVAEIDKLLSAAVLSGGGLSSRQHHEAVEALVDKELDDLLPAGGGAYHEDLIVRQAMRRVVGHLVMEESLLLLEGVEQGKRALEAEGKLHKPGSRNSWALW